MSEHPLSDEAMLDENERPVPLGSGREAAPASTPVEVATAAPNDEDFSSATMVRARASAPATGLRRLVYRVSCGTLILGPSATEVKHHDLVARVKTPVDGCRQLVVASRKGGVGKTTTCAFLSHTLAAYRGDRVIAVDGNPDAGTLGVRLLRENTETITTLLRDREHLRTYGDVRAYTSQAPSRLEVLAADDDPRITEALGEEDFRTVVDVLQRFYNLICLDTGTGVLDSANRGILRLGDQLVVVTTAAVDAGWAVARTLEWLSTNGHDELVRRAVVVVNAVHTPGGGVVDIERIDGFFRARCRAVIHVPWDPHLASGVESSLEELRPETQDAYLNLAATVAADFRSPATQPRR
jgi:putative peptide zinc metalloprotease protein